MRRLFAAGLVLAAITTRLPAASAQYHASQQWARIEADNGAAYGIDIGNVGRVPGGATQAVMCQIDVDGHHCVGGRFWQTEALIFWFDCRGRYIDMSHPSFPHTGWHIAPPRSIIGRASDLACEKANVLPMNH